MSRRTPAQGERSKPPGPEPERFAIAGHWKAAVGKALAKGKPPKNSPKKKRRSK